MAAKGKKKAAAERPLLEERRVYDTELAGQTLGRSEKTIRALCRNGMIRSRLDRGGYMIMGYALREYVEGRRGRIEGEVEG